MLEIVETQAALEAYVAGYLAETEVSEYFKSAIMESFSTADTAILNGDFTKARECTNKFTEIMYQELGNSFLYKTVQDLAERVSRIRLMQLNQGEAPLFLSQKQHKVIYDAIINKDKEAAYSAMFYHTKWYEEEMIKVLKNY